MVEDVQKPQIDFIKETIDSLLNFIGIKYSLDVQEGGEGVWFVIKTEDSPLLIGEGGKNLLSLNYLVRRIAERKYKDNHFLIDVNDYHKKQIDEIKDLARMHAQRVRYFKKDIEMPAMNAYERRIVHSILQEYPDIKTESSGTGLDRRVVIKPYSIGS